MNNQNIIVLLIILVFLSSFFSASETAFSSLNKIRLKYLANNGNKKAEKTLELTENYNELLNTVLVGNNIVNIVSATLATILFVDLFKENGAAYSSFIMTLIILIFGEIAPKTIAKISPEKFAIAMTPFISFFIFILKPLTIVFNLISVLIKKLFKEDDSEEFRSEEFITMVEEAQEDGELEEDEADLITNAIEFNDQDVGKVLTPRVDVTCAEITDDLESIDKLFRESGFSRIPIYEDSLDNILGVLHEKDFYYLYYKEGKTSIKQILSKPVYTSEHVKISALLKQLQNTKSHMAVVVDEYGGTAGIITMEDILEEIVGEIYDEHDEVVSYFKKINENEYYVDCDADIEDMFEYFAIKMDEEYDFNTVSGWVVHLMDKIPKEGEEFSFGKLNVLITKADEKVVEQIKVTINDSNKEN